MDAEIEVRAAAGRYLAALVAADPVSTIALLSPKAQAELLDAARRYGLEVDTALAAVTAMLARWRSVFTLFANDEIDVVEVTGGTATATYRDPDDPRPDPGDIFVLRRIDGQWLIDEFRDDGDDGER